MLRRLEPIAATDPPPDGCTPPRPRWGTSLCWRNAARSTELRNVSWLHIPKTGSTFARLIFRAACGVVPANRSHELFTEASAMHPIIALACPGAFRYFASWHTPLSQAAAEECGTHQRHCVSVLRAPAERVESGFYHAMHDCTWLQQAHGLSESGLNRTFYATFADETPKLYAHCVGGCSSRMLTGRPCGRCRPDAVSDVEGCIRRVWREAIGTDGAPYLDAILQKARRQKSCRACVADDEPADDDGSAAARVLRRFSFVGVQSAWNDTVHAFAERFGVPPLASDLVVSRPGWKPPPSQAERVARTAALFRAERRAYRADEVVVRAAEARLQSHIARHRAARRAAKSPEYGGELGRAARPRAAAKSPTYSDEASRWLEKSGWVAYRISNAVGSVR